MDIQTLLTIIAVLLTIIVGALVVLTWRIIIAIETLRYIFANANSIIGDVRGLKDTLKIGMLSTAIGFLRKFTQRR